MKMAVDRDRSHGAASGASAGIDRREGRFGDLVAAPANHCGLDQERGELLLDALSKRLQSDAEMLDVQRGLCQWLPR